MSRRYRSSPAGIYARLALTALFWGGAFIAARLLALELPHFVAATGRYIVATAALFTFLWFREGSLPKPTPRQWLGISLLGATGVFLYNAFFFSALAELSASRAALIIATNPALELSELLREAAPHIDEAARRAKGAFTWRTIDEDLLTAELTFDSSQRAEPALTRGSDSGRVMVFSVELESVEIEVLTDRVVGQFTPASSGQVEVEGDGGVVATVPVDDLGFFVITPVADRRGPVPVHDAVHPPGHRLGATVSRSGSEGDERSRGDPRRGLVAHRIARASTRACPSGRSWISRCSASMNGTVPGSSTGTTLATTPTEPSVIRALTTPSSSSAPDGAPTAELQLESTTRCGARPSRSRS